MFHLGEIAVLILASLWLVEGQSGSVRTADYKVLRNNSGQCYLRCSYKKIIVLDLVKFMIMIFI